MIGKNDKDIQFRKNVFGEIADYTIYCMSQQEKLVGYLIGLSFSFISMQILFHKLFFSLVLGITFGFVSLPFFQKYLLKKQKNILLYQFSDLLESLSGSFSAGRNTVGAFTDSYYDLSNQYGNDSIIVNEVKTILAGLENNFTIEVLLVDLAKRCHLEDVDSFVDIFIVCIRNGGNLRKVVMESQEMLVEKIAICREIETTIIEKKNELNIMLIMPLIVILMLNGLGSEAITSNSPINIIVKVIAVLIFGLSYSIGRKITNIKV